jgi:CRP/FNR family transcriptional regulator, cyclic AMP receptor protein
MKAVSETYDDRFLGRLQADDRAALNSLGRVLRAPRGAVLMYEGEPGDRIMVLLDGRAKVTRFMSNGHEALVGITDPGDLLGEVALLDSGPRTATVTALEPVSMLVIAASIFAAYLERRPRVAHLVLEVLSSRLRHAVELTSELAGLDALGRLASRLVELVDRYGRQREDGIEISLELAQDELAAWTGTSRASLGKALQTLRAVKCVETRRRQILIRDVVALETYAGRRAGPRANPTCVAA